MRTGRPRSFDRDRALEQAIAVFWEHGYDATSVSLLTKALGIGAPSLYAAFGDKRALFLEALDRYNHTYGAFTARALAEEPDARDAIERLLHEAAAAYTRPDRPPGCLLITAATNCSPQSADVADQLRELRVMGTHALEDKIATAARTGQIPARTDTRALAIFYTAVIQGMSAQARDGATTTDLHQVAATALQAWPSTTEGLEQATDECGLADTLDGVDTPFSALRGDTRTSSRPGPPGYSFEPHYVSMDAGDDDGTRLRPQPDPAVPRRNRTSPGASA